MALHELFPSWTAVRRHREAVLFTCGLMRDPAPLVDHVGSLCASWHLGAMRAGQYYSDDGDLLNWLYTESNLPRQDSNINYYNHGKDDRYKRSRDVAPIHVPSKLFVFNEMKEEISCQMNEVKIGDEVPPGVKT